MNRKKMEWLRKVYDQLFKIEKNPVDANRWRLTLEVESYYRRKGYGVSFANFNAPGNQLDDFLDRNEEALKELFAIRFPNPIAYSFRKKIGNSLVDSILGSSEKNKIELWFKNQGGGLR